MWCGGFIYFDEEKGKQVIITFVQKDLVEVLVSIAKQISLELSKEDLLQSEDPVALMTERCRQDKYFRNYAEVPKGWSFFVRRIHK